MCALSNGNTTATWHRQNLKLYRTWSSLCFAQLAGKCRKCAVFCIHRKFSFYLFSRLISSNFLTCFQMYISQVCWHSGYLFILFTVDAGQTAVEGRVERETCWNLPNAVFPSLFSFSLLCQAAWAVSCFFGLVFSSPAWRSRGISR